jgi:hypothetical protein
MTMTLKPKDNARYMILNAFYLAEQQRLVIHWVEMLDKNLDTATVIIETYPFDDEDAAQTAINELLKTQPLPPSYRNTPYGLAVNEVERLRKLLYRMDLSTETIMDISNNILRYMTVASLWEHDRKN